MKPKTSAVVAVCIAITIAPTAASAQVYKCMQNGSPIFSERPCGKDATQLQLKNTDVTEDQRQRAEESARRQRALRGDIEAQQGLEQAERQLSAQRSKNERAAKEAKCARYQRQAVNANNEANTYRYHQGLIDDARRREKEANDRHFSECYSR